ncbi:transformation/transcription domain-associated protein-like isoform X9 [Dreissena polymorpha]|nr:transformation/transcription domain-associated protein-like isoform X3 [Dreissena polymorpha]XP_052224461.1 transformation/transcription domain-associated protein-like isoform X4 [Dreissena polymorpha]XP_052224462.1 transformation/transcription domain-associated protein-like isoform X5 [Dreissena polymorpha]XP_052224463.1 transformation/transcription domain-associated protein-like isoform X6 [Dreissena polymorpha]XP_052224464.1 transformation/transcription domain-associated protein-like isof
MNDEIQDFLKFVNQIYTNLPKHLSKIFEPRSQTKVKDIAEINVDALLQETYTVTTIITDKKNPENQSVSYNIIPRGVLSLKVLAELPIIVVLMYQLYKPSVHQEVANFIPLIMNTITLQPQAQHRAHPAFNKEVFVDFVAAQIKTLSFLAYIVRIFQEQVQQHSAAMVQGHLSLLSLCPQEVAHLRKELLIAAKHILATDLRNKFVPVIDKLFDETVLVGTGWTTYESLRPLAYSTLADLVHHVRQQLPMAELSRAVSLFSKNVHDESLLSSIQTMSCKLLLNLVDCIRQKSEQENGNGRELLMRMLEVFVLKFKTIAKIQLPQILAKCQKQVGQAGSEVGVSPLPGRVGEPKASTPPLTAPPPLPATPTIPDTPCIADMKPPLGSVSADIKETSSSKEDKPPHRFGVTPSQYNTYSVADCRGLVKTLVCGVKTITWGIVSCKAIGPELKDTSLVQNKQFLPQETLVYVRLVKYALQALDIYTINVSPSGQAVVRPAVVQTVRTKEEKEVLEHFAGVFTMMSPFTFKEIFATTIEFMVDRIHNNYALQIVANTFLANPTTSATFATILVEYLLARLEEMGSNMDRSNLYLKLFKLVFGSVSLFAAENEQMLKPHLHTIVNRSMELAMSAKEPYNYFLLLRALFRSIGSGGHDLLYQEFLPLLPNLLQGLNSLQSGLHRQHMKDLFVELCLTVPVRLSSLLPYLPMLMDPLVSALNGSQTLVSQGLRTLELCVDNLQPDFLYDHIQPVRAELMQALWRTLRNPVDNIAHVAFRVLGKFGGGNRKMLREPQTLQYNDKETVGPCISIYFQDCKQPVSLPVERAIDSALAALKSSTTDTYYRKQAWELIRCFLVSVMNLEDEKSTLDNLFTHPSFTEGEIPVGGQLYKNPDAHSRKVHEQALIGMFVAAAIKELRQNALRFMGCMVRHYTMIAISQQCGPFPVGERQNKLQGMDTQILIDALAVIMGHEEKELCKPGNLALVLILETATSILGSKERACQLPMFEYLVEKMCSLCYDRAWYAKCGGCVAIKSLTERMALKWVLEHQFLFLKALFFVMMDLTGEVSSGAVDLARANLDILLTMCAGRLEGEQATEEMLAVQTKSFHDITYELVRQVTSPNTTVRETAMKSLETLAGVAGKTVAAIMEPHKEVLQDMIPPKKHLLRHQPANAQIGLMDGNTFCTTLNPRLFTIDLTITEHNVYFSELQNLCDAEDSVLLKLPCYKSVTNLMPLRKSALRALAACSYIPGKREKIFQVLYKALNSKSSDLQEVAHECMKSFQQFIANGQIEMEIVHSAMRPLLLMLGDYRNLDLNVIQRLSSLTQLFPNTFNEKLCEQLLTHLKKWLEIAGNSQKTGQVRTTGQELKICAAIINIFHLIPAASKKMIEPLVKVTLQGEKTLLLEPGSPFREPLGKFLVRYPVQTVEFLLSDTNIRDMQYLRYFVYLLSHSEGQAFRDVLKMQVMKLVSMMTATAQVPPQVTLTIQQQVPVPAAPTSGDLVYQAIVLTHTLVRLEEEWLSNHPQLMSCLRKLWVSEEFQADKSVQEISDYTQWKVLSLVAKCLLNYFRHNTGEIELLFDLLRCFTTRHVSQYQFVKDFLDNTVAVSYTVEWKRKAFFKYVEIFHDPAWPQTLKAKIIQYVLLPCYHHSLEGPDAERLIGGPAQPDLDNPENIVSVFINKVIDPENPFGNSDAVRILLLQFSSLLVEQAAPHVHDAANKKQGNKLRRLMTFAWPCLLMKNCIDPATKYHGHLLLSHIIAKFAIHKRIVLQVFHSLLKAHALEARAVVKQALEILTPAMPGRMEDGNGMLTHWTKKIIVEDGHAVAQLVHILQLVVRHYKVYYPVRHHLIQHMVNSLQRLGFTQNATVEHRKLAVDLAEVIIKWEIQRIKEDSDTAGTSTPAEIVSETGQVKRAGSVEPVGDVKKPRYLSGSVGSPEPQPRSPESSKPIEKQYCDAVVNFLLRIACQVSEVAGSPGEVLSRRCVTQLKNALRPDVWPNTELKLAWFDKLLNTVESQQPNFNNICTALELLCFLLTILKREQILASFKPLQRGIAACMNCPNMKVIRGVHSLLSRLMSFFPTEPLNSSVASKYEELECLYACVSKVVYEGLTNYDKATNGSSSQLFSTLMILKAACMHNQCYIDRLITVFMKVLTKMVREHLQPATTTETSPVASELLIISLDLVKNRVVVMSMEMRKSFIGQILVGLIEKTPDSKVMKAITKMVEDWVKTKGTIALNQSPSIREKAILLVKLMVHIEKRFSEDLELNAQFLELVIYIYRDEALSGTELTSKLEQAFLGGLRCSQPAIRHKFVEVFNASIPRRVFDRLLYITCSQNWEAMGAHFWIKQCIELLMSVAVTGHPIQSCSSLNLLPSASSVVSLADVSERAQFANMTRMKEEPMDVEAIDHNKEDEEIDIELSVGSEETPGVKESPKKECQDPKQNLVILLQRQAKFLENCREVKTFQFLNSLSQLCHSCTDLSHITWLALFPRIWKVLSEKQQQMLSAELVPFLCSGCHVIQKDCHPSAIHTFTESLALCVPPVPVRPTILKYLGRTHNLWYRSCLLLEQTDSAGSQPLVKSHSSSEYEFEPTTSPLQETLDALCDLYSLLKEDDMWAGLWQKRAKFSETTTAIAYEQHGFFEQAQGAYEAAMSKARVDHNAGPANPSIVPEYRLWEDHWIRCSKELNQWDHLLEYANSKGNTNPHLVLESAWRVPNWALMKDALSQVELSCPKEMAWKVNLYRGYIAICHPDEHHLNMIERLVELSSNLAIKEWRRLPHIVTHIHVPLLQAAQQIMELQEAAQINLGLQPANITRSNSLHDMKAIVKTWRNRLPMISDDLSHWSDIFTWRQHHYQFIVNHYDPSTTQDQQQSQNHSMLGVHASAQAIIHFGKIARKHSLSGVCLDSLSRIHTIPSVPIVDCFQKIRQQVKCYLQMAGAVGKPELNEGLEVIESTNLKYFTKEMTAEFYALKGMFLAQTGRSEDANKSFSAAVQMHDTLVKAWALWGDYLETVFTKDKQMHVGVSAITCFLHACRHQNESKSRKYLAKVLWLLTYDDETSKLAEAVDKYCVGVPPLQWLPWIPQLLTCLVRNEGRLIMNLLGQVGRMFPQAVYFPIRTLYLTLKIEQRERCTSDKTGEATAPQSKSPQVSTATSASSLMLSQANPGLTTPTTPEPTITPSDLNGGTVPPTTSASTPGSSNTAAVGGRSSGQSEAGPIRAPAPMWRCSRIMHIQRELHPTILSSLEGIVDQMVWFRENWYEEVLRQLRQGLAKCYAVAFENRANVADATITPHTLNFVKKLVSTFGVGIENVSNVVTTFSSAASESLARRAQATAQDPIFQKMKSQFTTDFDFNVPGSMKLHNLINKLKKWIKILEAKTKLLPKSFLIEEKCRFLSNFSQSTAEVELPGEFLLPKHINYYVRIARFMPRVEIVQKHSTAARRLYIRGHNGKIYPYLVVNDACLTESRREERVLQLLRMLNHFLTKQKETSRRMLYFTVPRVVAVSPQMRLVEDNPASVSLLDVYRQRCCKRGIEPDSPIARYYERLLTVQARGSAASHQVLRDVLKEVQNNMVPRGLLKEWALHTFLDATDYWIYRKTFTVQLALMGFAEFVLHLSRMDPDMLYLHQDCGYLNIAYFKFDIDDQSGDLDANRPVPFRLTPNIAEFVTSTGVTGPLTAAMVATARCLVQPQYKLPSFLRAILRDEYITWHKKKQEEVTPGTEPSEMEGEQLITMVTKAVTAITNRLHNLATFEGAESKVNTLVAAANSHDNLCRMDPAWHPWL